jgi:dihydroxyacetone kinase-like protein
VGLPRLGPCPGRRSVGTLPPLTGRATLAPERPFIPAPGPQLGAQAARAYLHRCSRIISRHAAALTRLDEVLGDGDHGDNLLAGFAAVDDGLAEPKLPVTNKDDVASLPVTNDDDLASLLTTVGATLVASVGGASGPLYGAAFMEAGFAARTLEAPTTTAALATMLEAAAAGLARRGHCAVGDKTIYDTLAPAAVALREAADRGDDEEIAILEMVRAAARGMRSTTNLVARRGLALRLGERSRGHRDPGAASCLLLLRALAGGDLRGR